MPIAEWVMVLGQGAGANSSGAGAYTLFYVTLLVVFLTAVVTTVATKWAKDKALKFFHGYHCTLERVRGQTTWGVLKVFSSGIEMVYDTSFVDPRGNRKTSYLIYQQEIDQQVLSVFRYHDELDEPRRRERLAQVHRTFNPRLFRRMWRRLRNLVNTLRDAFNTAIGTAVGQYQKMNPANAVLASQGGSVTQIGQTLLGRIANAYEPLLEQYIGRPVVLDVADPLDPNNVTVEYSGYLADYTQSYIAVFNVEHRTTEEVTLTLPDIDGGDPQVPLPPPPPPGAPSPVLPPPLKVEHDLAVRVDGRRFRVRNMRSEPVVIRRLVRPGFEPLPFGVVVPPRGTFDVPAAAARAGTLHVEIIRCLDVVAPRKYATIRHAGGAADERADEAALANEHALPLVPVAGEGSEEDRVTGA